MADYPIITDGKDSDLSLLATAIVQSDKEAIRAGVAKTTIQGMGHLTMASNRGYYLNVQISASLQQIEIGYIPDMIPLKGTPLSAWFASTATTETIRYFYTALGDIFRYNGSADFPNPYARIWVLLGSDRLAEIFQSRIALRYTDYRNITTEHTSDYLATREQWRVAESRVTSLDARITALEGR